MILLKNNLFKLLIFKIFYVLSINSSYAISGSEINKKLKSWLYEKKITSNPKFSENKVFKNCKTNIEFEKISKNFSLVKVFCPDTDGWKIYVRPNIVKSTNNKKKKTNNLQKVIILNKSLEKGDTITLASLKVELRNKQNSFFTNPNEILGRRLKQNLKKGKLLEPRHLFKRFDVNEGDQVIIVSNIGKAYVSSSGIAQKSGKIGDLLTVKNVRSGKVIKGYLKKNKKIHVFR